MNTIKIEDIKVTPQSVVDYLSNAPDEEVIDLACYQNGLLVRTVYQLMDKHGIERVQVTAGYSFWATATPDYTDNVAFDVIHLFDPSIHMDLDNDPHWAERTVKELKELLRDEYKAMLK